MRKIFVIVFLSVGIVSSNHIAAASFDCAKARTYAEKAICENEELSQLDEQLFKIYEHMLLSSPDRVELRARQRQWLRTDRNICTNHECIKAAYEKRLRELINVGKQLSCDQADDFNESYEIYVGVARDFRTYVQPRGAEFGLSETAISLVDGPSTLDAARLCDGNIVAVWLPFSYGKFPVFLTARIFDHKFNARTDSFRVTESDEAQWEHSLAALYNGNFVVTWKSDTQDGKDVSWVGIRARVFNASGQPLTQLINVSSPPGNNGQARAYGLPNGDFAVLWSGSGVNLRIFNEKGLPKTEQIPVINVYPSPGNSGLVAYGHINQDGVINVFMRSYNSLDKTPIIYAARSFDVNGKPLTGVLTADAIRGLEGYKQVVKHLVRENAYQLEYRLREFLQKDVMGFRFCRPEFVSHLIQANEIKSVSEDLSIKNFVTKFCQEYRKSCPANKYFEHDLEQCER